jgi:predicted secreted protein
MTKKPAFLLKVGAGGSPPTFATIAGMRVTSESRSPTRYAVCASGIFTGLAAEMRAKTNALTGLVDDYELSFENGERLRGRFLITRLDYAGDAGGERTFALALESSGPVETVNEPIRQVA